jgi:hypothetical protein
VIDSVTLNDEPLRHTLQVPDGALRPGDNTIHVRLAPGATPGERLSSSTVRLDTASTEGPVTRFEIVAYGQNRLTFGDLTRVVTVTDVSGVPVEVRSVPDGDFTPLYFEGRGAFTVTLE